MSSATLEEIYLVHAATGARVPVPHGAADLFFGGDSRPRLTSATATWDGSEPAPPFQARLHRQYGEVWLTAHVPGEVCLNGARPLDTTTRVQLAPGDAITIGSNRLTIYGCTHPNGVGSDAPTNVSPSAGHPVTSEPVPPTATITQTAPGAFGLEAHDVEFRRQGIGPEAASRLGQRFKWIKELSSGGMGKVILVQEVLSGRFVAMKIMLESAAANPAVVQQFVREAIITARLQHPHIIPVHDLGFLDGNQLYYTMSYIEGDNFAVRMPKLDLGDRIRVLRCAALAAAHAHDKCLWHRDIKPHNILVGELGDTYLIDWGLVSVQHDQEYKLNIPKVVVDSVQYALPDTLLSETDQAITREGGNILGTPAYMAPETITPVPEQMGAASDVWSLGIILFECLTGRHPVVRPKMIPQEIFLHVMGTRFPTPREIDPTVPPELDRLCARMLDKNPDRRIKSLKLVIDGLTSFLKAHAQPLTITSILSGAKQPAEQVARVADPTPSAEPPEAAHRVRQLEAERDRAEAKCKLLLELAQLGWFQFKRRRELWAKLVGL